MIAMFQPMDFPPLEQTLDLVTKARQVWKIKPQAIRPNGTQEPVSSIEAILNWQSQNVVVQNQVLMNIDQAAEKIKQRLEP